MDDLEYRAILDYDLFRFICVINKINHFIFRYYSSSVLHTFPTFLPYGYDTILSKVCNLLSLLLLSAVLLISLVYASCNSLLNLCCNSSTI